MSHTHTLLSDLRRIFFEAAGGQATAEATAFIIFVWDWIFEICWWCDGEFCNCCCCCWWLNMLDVLPATFRGDSRAGFIDWCDRYGDACDSHWSDSGSSHGPSLQIVRNNQIISLESLQKWWKMIKEVLIRHSMQFDVIVNSSMFDYSFLKTIISESKANAPKYFISLSIRCGCECGCFMCNTPSNT